MFRFHLRRFQQLKDIGEFMEPPHDGQKRLPPLRKLPTVFNTQKFDVKLKSIENYRASFDRFHESSLMLEKLRKKEPIPKLSQQHFIDMITYFTKFSKVKEADETFSRMKSYGLKPNILTYAKMAKVHATANDIAGMERIWNEAKSSGDSITPFFYTALVKGYARTQQLDKAQAIIDESRKQNKFSPKSMLGIMLHAYAMKGDLVNVKKILVDMEANFPVNFFTYQIGIYGMLKKGHIDGATALYKHMLESGIEPTAKIYNFFIHYYFVQKNVAQAERYYDIMKKAMIRTDLVTHSTLISGYLNNGNYEKAVANFVTLKGVKYLQGQLNSVVYLPAIMAYIHLNNFQEPEVILKTILTSRVIVDDVFYETLLKFCLNDMKNRGQFLDKILDHMLKTRSEPTQLMFHIVKEQKNQEALLLKLQQVASEAKAIKSKHPTILF